MHASANCRMHNLYICILCHQYIYIYYITTHMCAFVVVSVALCCVEGSSKVMRQGYIKYKTLFLVITDSHLHPPTLKHTHTHTYTQTRVCRRCAFKADILLWKPYVRSGVRELSFAQKCAQLHISQQSCNCNCSYRSFQ